MLVEHLLQSWGDLQASEVQLRMQRIGALLVQASRLCATATNGEAATSASEIPNILSICSHLHTLAMVAVRENDQHDAHEYLQNLCVNLAWGVQPTCKICSSGLKAKEETRGEKRSRRSPATG